MQLEKRALYNSLRLNWLIDPQVTVALWQVENYREWTIDGLFDALKKHQIQLDRTLFNALAEDCDTPEEFTDSLDEKAIDAAEQDEIYLIVFELWRRLLPEKQSLSVFCDELDHQIYLYDTDQVTTAEGIEDILANLKVILDENVDNGADPVDAFEAISAGCANDIESFIYDFISEQIDNQNLSYASELIDAFSDYATDVKGFDLLRTRVMADSDSDSDPEALEILIDQIMEEAKEDADVGFNLDVLNFLAKLGNKILFLKMLKQSLPLLQTESDFQDLTQVTQQYFHFLDDDVKEQALEHLLNRRSKLKLDQPFKKDDPDLQELVKAFTP